MCSPPRMNKCPFFIFASDLPFCLKKKNKLKNWVEILFVFFLVWVSHYPFSVCGISLYFSCQFYWAILICNIGMLTIYNIMIWYMYMLQNVTTVIICKNLQKHSETYCSKLTSITSHSCSFFFFDENFWDILLAFK